MDYPEPVKKPRKRTPKPEPLPEPFVIARVDIVREAPTSIRVRPDSDWTIERFQVRGGNDAADVTRAIFPWLSAAVREHFGILALDVRHRVRAAHIVSVGSQVASIVHPTMVYLPALLAAADTIVAFHNHPSGDATPSADDWALTERLFRAGDLIGIHLLDHIIITEHGYTSLRDDTNRAIFGKPHRF